jgi:fermentation-respiration switch protein FrsA (DUF1100 family)
MSLVRDALDRFIESNIFFPDPDLYFLPPDFGLEFEDVWFKASDGIRLHGWFVPAQGRHGLLLFCHGNAGNISHRLDNIRRLHDRGLSVFIFDYRGYGRSHGRITEQGFYLDSEAAYEIGARMAARDDLKLVIFGRSLGGIAAVHLGAIRPCSGLILESTFPHMGAMAAEHYPLSSSMIGQGLRKRLNSVDKIGSVTAPILFFHGDCDDIVPIRLGRELFDAAQTTKEFAVLGGAGHNDTYVVGGEKYFDKFISFVDGLPHGNPGSGPVT